jgi:diguanylate cyclase (GGDEF)-like protein/PAS domain S-box-containing protein
VDAGPVPTNSSRSITVQQLVEQPVPTNGLTLPVYSAQESHEVTLDLARENEKLREQNRLLLEQNNRLQRVIEGSEVGFWDWDLINNQFIVSERFESMLGFALGERDLSPENWSRFVHPDDLATAKESIDRNLNGDSPFHEVEIRTLTKQGDWKRILTRGKIVSRDENGKPLMMSGTHTDITERNALFEELEARARKDYLTGLTNRGHFMELAEWELKKASRYGKDTAVIMIDIDNFKAINDTYGHETGDAVLKKLAEVFHETLRQVDVIGRIGGDEFAVFQPETNLDQALTTAERLRDSVQNSSIKLANGEPLSFTVSIGVIARESENSDLQELLSQADKALYKAKNSGRNRVCV